MRSHLYAIRWDTIKYLLKHVCALCIIIMYDGLTTHTILCRRYSACTLTSKRRCLQSPHVFIITPIKYRIKQSFCSRFLFHQLPEKLAHFTLKFKGKKKNLIYGMHVNIELFRNSYKIIYSCLHHSRTLLCRRRGTVLEMAVVVLRIARSI